MNFKFCEKSNSVEIAFRKGIYSEESIENAVSLVCENLKVKKKDDANYFHIILSPPEKTDLFCLAFDFCNLVIAEHQRISL